MSSSLVTLQAKRLVRNSILSVETTDTQVDEVDFVDDAADVEDFVRSHRDGDDASGSGAAPQGKPLILKHLWLLYAALVCLHDLKLLSTPGHQHSVYFELSSGCTNNKDADHRTISASACCLFKCVALPCQLHTARCNV